MSASIGGELERRRLERRAVRLALVVALLGERVSAGAREGTALPGLERSLRDFAGELAHVRRRLAQQQREQVGPRALARRPSRRAGA
ncbi:MAG TPA: hypothetical protein VL977_05135 [Solirubrobacteraceae bacterium]|nr:hypothetical protein [Solirubrobacteraceae bacterium]